MNFENTVAVTKQFQTCALPVNGQIMINLDFPAVVRENLTCQSVLECDRIASGAVADIITQ